MDFLLGKIAVMERERGERIKILAKVKQDLEIYTLDNKKFA